MLRTYRRLFGLLDARERRRVFQVLGMIMIMGLLEVAGVASILPFLAVLSNPGVVETNPYLAAAYAALGFAAVDRFLIFLGIVTFGLVVFGQAFKALTVYALTRFSQLRQFTIGSRLLGGYLHQPYVWFLDRHTADLGKSVLSEVQMVVGGLMIPALRMLVQVTLAVLLVAVLFAVNPMAAAVTAVIVGAGYGLIFMVARRYLSRIGQDRVRANTERYRAAQEAMGGIKDVKLLGLEDAYLQRFRSPAQRFAQREAASAVINEVPRYLLEAVVFGAMMLLLLILMATAEGRLDEVVPVIGVYAFAGARLFPALQQIYSGAVNLRYNQPALDALEADLAAFRRTERSAGPKAPAPLPLRRHLRLADIHFHYPEGRRPALRGLDIEIEANATVGVVGVTGAGKTTAVDVILGLLEPQRGQVLVDGVAIGRRNLRAWQRSLGYVPQHIFLTDDTVAANIALGFKGDEIDMAAVERAARIAEFHGFVVEELPDGYETRVGERGVRLSGGQRQRIGIARALYRDPTVLILDEATSALDNMTERAVMDAVHNLSRRKTIIMIAHRLSTVQGCERIFVLEQGRCVAAGRYGELMETNNDFRKLALPS